MCYNIESIFNYGKLVQLYFCELQLIIVSMQRLSGPIYKTIYTGWSVKNVTDVIRDTFVTFRKRKSLTNQLRDILRETDFGDIADNVHKVALPPSNPKFLNGSVGRVTSRFKAGVIHYPTH